MSVISVGREEESLPAETLDLEAILARISAGASGRDAHPSFPEEWRVLRAVAGADGSVGRILDGHFNGVDRVSLLAPESLRSRELEAIAAGKLLLGVWGADPIPGEGEPARLVQDEAGPRARPRAWPRPGTTPPCLRRPLRRRKGR